MFNKFVRLQVRPKLELQRRVSVVRRSLQLREVVGESERRRRERLQQKPVGPVEGQGRRDILVDDVEGGTLKSTLEIFQLKRGQL